MKFRIQHPIIQPTEIDKRAIKQKKSEKTVSFKQLFQAELENETNLKVSKHAETRMRQRGISLSNETWNKVEKAVQNARNKGVQEAVVLTKKAAFIVSTTNELIITALDRKSPGEHLFTNVDGTILIDE